MTLWQIWWIALAVKTILLPIIPITPDEAYYLAWARHPALSYFDHPPFISYIMRLALPLWNTSVGIRWPGIIFGHIGYIPWFYILHKLKLSSRAQIYWMLLLLFGPLTGLGGFVITPDVPLVFFWGWGIAALMWTFEKPAIRRWLVVGVIAGLGMLSKYMMILFFPATFLYMAWDNRLSEFKRPGLWLATLVAIMVFSPVIIWNYQNHFASFAFQTHHGLSNQSFQWNFPVEYVTTQLGLLNPFWAVPGLWLIWKDPLRNKILLFFTAVPFVFFFITSFRARVEGNWAVCAYPSFMALLVTMVDRPNEWKRWKNWVNTGLTLSWVFILLVISHTVHPWLPIPKDRDHTEITREWLVDIDALKPYQPLYARSYQMAAFHSYYRPADNEVFKLAGLDRKDFYDFLPESTPHAKAYIVLKGDEQLPEHIKNTYDITNAHELPSHLFVYDIAPKSTAAAAMPAAPAAAP